MADEMMMNEPPGSMPPEDMGGMGSPAGETVEVPSSMLGGAKVGQTVELTVDAIDEKTGMATLSAGMGEQPENEGGSAIEGAANLFNE
ncbi:MAG TPA: hypothetical protein VMY18_03430 [Acidobacteriota bacterium]|nr:hypothetical protein [Acidobacteriota bacterium]